MERIPARENAELIREEIRSCFAGDSVGTLAFSALVYTIQFKTMGDTV